MKFLEDPDLSWKAKGLLMIVASNPRNDEYSMEYFLSKGKGGRESLSNGIKELIDQGYLVKKQTREKNGKMSKCNWKFFIE